MNMSPLRRKLYNGEMDMGKKEDLLREYEYFSSIAQKGIFENFNLANLIRKLGEMPPVSRILVLVVFILFLPFCAALLPMLLIVMVFSILIKSKNQSPEYKSYDYSHRIGEGTLKLIDDDLKLWFAPDPAELVDEQMGYDQALIESHLLMPIKAKHYSTSTGSQASYNWDNPNDTESFQFQGYRVYYVWTDSDGDTHEDVYFDGAIYKFHTSFFVNGSINIMSTKTKQKLFGGEKEKNVFKSIKNKDINVIDTENVEFAENFDTVATYDQEAYRYLTPAVIEALLQLRKQYFFCVCIKGNVMTVTVDNMGYGKATKGALGEWRKPSFRFRDPAATLDMRIREVGSGIISIYELKDILDPAARPTG